MKLCEKYKAVVKEYLTVFCTKQECEVDFEQNSHYYFIADYSISFDEIKYDIDFEIEKGLIFKYQNYCLNEYEKGNKPMNYMSWLSYFHNYKLNIN
jgi:hypothetical protein